MKRWWRRCKIFSAEEYNCSVFLPTCSSTDWNSLETLRIMPSLVSFEDYSNGLRLYWLQIIRGMDFFAKSSFFLCSFSISHLASNLFHFPWGDIWNTKYFPFDLIKQTLFQTAPEWLGLLTWSHLASTKWRLNMGLGLASDHDFLCGKVGIFLQRIRV